MTVEEVSKEAYEQMRESGKISELQDLAFKTIREFYEEHDYWPTQREAHAFLALEKGNDIARLKGPAYIRRRLSELVVDPDDDNPDLLEKLEKRGQKYLVENVDEIESTAEAHPIKIVDEYVERWVDTGPGEEQVEETGYRTETLNGQEIYIVDGQRYLFPPDESEVDQDSGDTADSLAEEMDEAQDTEERDTGQKTLWENGEAVS